MVVPLNEMRELLLPPLIELRYSFAMTKEIWASNYLIRPAAPHIWIPKLTLPQAIAAAAAAAVIKNPEVTRRFWAGWMA